MKTLILSLFCLVDTLFATVPLDLQKAQEALFRGQTLATRTYLKSVNVDHLFDDEEEDEEEEYLQSQRTPPYQLVINNLPPYTQFDWYIVGVDLMHNPWGLASGYINENGEGVIRLEDHEVELSNLYLQIGRSDRPLFPAEPLFDLIVTSDLTYLASSRVPFPIEAFGKEGRRVWIEIQSGLKNEGYILVGDNFVPGEVVSVSIQEKNLAETHLRTVSQEGTFFYQLDGSGKEKGASGTLEVLSSVSTEPLTLQYQWGYCK